MVFEHLQGCCSLLRVTAINLTLQWSRRHQLRVLPELATHINDPDPLVRAAAINATCQMLTALGPDLLLQYIPAPAVARYEDPDPSVRLAAINAIRQLLPALAEAKKKDPDPRVRVAAIEAINNDPDPRVRVAAIEAYYRLPAHLDPDLLWQYIAALAAAIYEDPHPHVRKAAINATWHLSFNFYSNSQFQHHSHVLPALAAAISEDPDPHVRLVAINATVRLSTDLDPNLRLPDLYCFYVLPALHGAICDFKDLIVQEHAAFAMINISKNYPLDASPFGRHTVGILLEDHASSRERLELQHQEDIALEDIDLGDIASDRNQISASESLLIKFELELPHDTWDSILARLTPNQQAEYLGHVGLNMALYEDPDPLVRVAAINKTVRLFANLSNALRPDMLPALAKAICDDPDPDVKLAAINAAVQLPFVLPDLAQAIYDFENLQFQEHAASAVINISKSYQRETLTPDLVEIVGTLLEFRSREDIALDQTRILAIENLLKQFRDKLPPHTWTSTWSSLLDYQQREFLSIVAHREDQEEST